MHPKFIYGFPTYPWWVQINIVFVPNFILSLCCGRGEFSKLHCVFGLGLVYFSILIYLKKTPPLIYFGYVTCNQGLQSWNLVFCKGGDINKGFWPILWIWKFGEVGWLSGIWVVKMQSTWTKLTFWEFWTSTEFEKFYIKLLMYP